MHRFILGLGGVTVACATMADAPKNEADRVAVAQALETFAGTWEIIRVEPSGATMQARQLVFSKDGTYVAQDKDGNELWAGTFEIDPTVMPKRWDHRSHDAKQENKDVLGIYKLEGDRLNVACVVGQWKGQEWIGKSRPTDLRPEAADVVIEFRRAKPSK